MRAFSDSRGKKKSADISSSDLWREKIKKTATTYPITARKSIIMTVTNRKKRCDIIRTALPPFLQPPVPRNSIDKTNVSSSEHNFSTSSDPYWYVLHSPLYSHNTLLHLYTKDIFTSHYIYVCVYVSCMGIFHIFHTKLKFLM